MAPTRISRANFHICTGWANNSAFGIIGGPNRHQSRPVTIRLLACQACRQLSSVHTNPINDFHHIEAILRVVDQLKPLTEAPIAVKELLDICETEGNGQNGGGHFSIKHEGSRGLYVKFEPGNSTIGGRGGAPGEIGSPVVGHAMPFGGRGFQTPGQGIPAPSGF